MMVLEHILVELEQVSCKWDPGDGYTIGIIIVNYKGNYGTISQL